MVSMLERNRFGCSFRANSRMFLSVMSLVSWLARQCTVANSCLFRRSATIAAHTRFFHFIVLHSLSQTQHDSLANSLPFLRFFFVRDVLFSHRLYGISFGYLYVSDSINCIIAIQMKLEWGQQLETTISTVIGVGFPVYANLYLVGIFFGSVLVEAIGNSWSPICLNFNKQQLVIVCRQVNVTNKLQMHPNTSSIMFRTTIL